MNLIVRSACDKLAVIWCADYPKSHVYMFNASADSIYTERYMNLPDLNPGGYINASISNVTAFQKVDFLLAHGSADDNVHFANSAHLLDMFTKARVRNFRFRMFTDR
jgi:dipeptidyl aminopeptidase/acylaminoacyl peptidase